MKLRLLGSAIVATLLLPLQPLDAQLQTYTFESQPFLLTSPMAALAPDFGSAGFFMGVTAAPLTDGFVINQYNGPAEISGQNLLFNTNYIATGPVGTLSLTFSASVTSIQMIIEMVTGTDTLVVTDNHGGSQIYTPDGFDIGVPVIHFSYTPSGPIEGLDLAFNNDSSSGLYFVAIDNLSVVAVPEPATWLAGAIGLGTVVWRRRRLARGAIE